MAVVFLVLAALLFPTVCPLYTPMPPRRKLLRLWLAARLGVLGCVGASICLFLSPYYYGVAPSTTMAARDKDSALLVTACSFLASFLVTPRAVRGRVLRLLGSLTKRSGQQQEAALIASLCAGKSAAEVLVVAEHSFTVLPLRLPLTGRDGRAVDLFDKDEAPRLRALTRPGWLGECDAFVSHSWYDDAEQKYQALQAWAAAADEDVHVWLDAACIDPNNIQRSLLCLPVFLSGEGTSRHAPRPSCARPPARSPPSVARRARACRLP